MKILGQSENLGSIVVSLKVLKLLFSQKSLIFRTNLFQTMAMAYSGTIFSDTAIYIVWFTFILGSIFVFPHHPYPYPQIKENKS